jgi:hypothetical protein
LTRKPVKQCSISKRKIIPYEFLLPHQLGPQEDLGKFECIQLGVVRAISDRSGKKFLTKLFPDRSVPMGP